MLNIRIVILSVLLVLVLVGAISFVVSASSVDGVPFAAADQAAACVAQLSDQELRDILNSRYEHRCCGLPR
ncbi:MAG: hypothetical protein L0287_16795 [Anaerolineae bacterium]|nr:hypothetical protein [Anaerolineae bacterium]MCI0610565.1 hypothetical protein [Anaerolineae bacterium]